MDLVYPVYCYLLLSFVVWFVWLAFPSRMLKRSLHSHNSHTFSSPHILTMDVSGRPRFVMESYSLRNMYLIGFLVNVLHLFVGMTTVWTSPVVAHLLSPYLLLSTLDKSAIASSASLGAVLGVILAGTLITRYGNKSVFGLNVFVSICSLLFLSAPDAVIKICLGRLFAGVFVGATLSHIPVYISEISEPEVLSILKVLILPTQALGYLLVYVLGCHLTYEQLLYLFTPIPAFSLVCLVCIPESPKYYMASGKPGRAKETIAILKRGISTGAVEMAAQVIQEHLDKQPSSEKKWIDLSKPANKQALGLALILVSLLNLSGPSVVFSLTETLLVDSKGSLSTTMSLTAIGVGLFIISLVRACFDTTWNSKNQLIIGLVTMAISMLLFGLYFINLESGKEVNHLNWVPLSCILLFLIAFVLGVARNVEDICEALCSSQSLSMGAYVLQAAASFFSFLIIFTFLPLRDILGYTPVLWGFCALCIITAVFVSVSIPNTTSMSSTDLQNFLNNGSLIIPCSRRKDNVEY